ncbi:hypothetical protein NDI76_06175 [Halogeometricum sp. S1BR25-6]|uniref:Uncharacterized protein n=1 Tax=Halogeometricum salsisoli TaxID=2950536 RepID=A0ABU2GBY6_9EURY|nr:hypothetical protein [Halogeometricum sp. S1BR25-6]MDS0298323.1 hypothetical protein [Halogeometricum sp. S1BR25-6]
MPTAKFEVADYDVAVEPWSPIKRRIVLQSPAGGDDGDDARSESEASRDEATLLFTPDRTETGETGVVTGVDSEKSLDVWAYFDLAEFDDVLRLLESESEAYLHFGHASGSADARSLYFVSVETTSSVPGEGDGELGSSLPFGAQNGEESLELSVEEEAIERVEGRRERN